MKRLVRPLTAFILVALAFAPEPAPASEKGRTCDGEQVVVTQMGVAIPQIVREILLRCDPELGVHLGEGRLFLPSGDVDVALLAFRRGSNLFVRLRDTTGEFGLPELKFIWMPLKGLPMEQRDFSVYRALPEDRKFGSGMLPRATKPIFRLRERVPGKIRVSVVDLNLPPNPTPRLFLDRLLDRFLEK